MAPAIQKGYTIIEILVVLLIIGLLVGAGYANIRGYQRRQLVIGAARELEANLRYAQELALSGNKPTSAACGTDENLDSIRFQAFSDISYGIIAICTGGNVAIKSINLPASSRLYRSQNIINFLPLALGTDLAPGTSAIFGVCGFNEKSGLSISSTGEISQTTSFICP